MIEGLSPPTRGSRRRSPALHGSLGSIPAHTGKPSGTRPSTAATGVYPRPHGEAPGELPLLYRAVGLSPPTRGSRRLHTCRRRLLGSIPAHTGKPGLTPPNGRRRRVYPRPHGEAGGGMRAGVADGGLSPPTRGSRSGPTALAKPPGSIPAHTGKPPGPLISGSAGGLSPPTRGSPRTTGKGSLRAGSIPAHTGKPAAFMPARPAGRVYPRPHGEAYLLMMGVRLIEGLSPPTRGSPADHLEHLLGAGSIPAHTGKPSSPCAFMSAIRVYPRPHGEARYLPEVHDCDDGLSPPTRGSQDVMARPRLVLRSIPAHTGKPTPHSGRRAARSVYPRPHGEAFRGPTGPARQRGLSPPTRGSRPDRRLPGHGLGSIPAHTGKPRRLWTAVPPQGVYPRPHGEAVTPAPSSD